MRSNICSNNSLRERENYHSDLSVAGRQNKISSASAFYTSTTRHYLFFIFLPDKLKRYQHSSDKKNRLIHSLSSILAIHQDLHLYFININIISVHIMKSQINGYGLYFMQPIKIIEDI